MFLVRISISYLIVLFLLTFTAMKRSKLVTIVLFAFVLTGTKQVFSQTLDDVDSLIGRFDKYTYEDPTLAKEIADTIVKVGETYESPGVIGNGYHCHGILSMNNSDYTSALTLFKKSLNYYLADEDSCGVKNAYFNIGSVLSSLGDDVRAINYYRLSEQIRCEDEDYFLLVYNMATTFYSLELDSLGRKYVELLIDMEDSDNLEKQMTKYIGYVMFSKYLLAEDKDTMYAIALLEEAIESGKNYDGYESDLVMIYSSLELATIYQNLGNESKVNELLKLAKTVLDNMPFKDEDLVFYYQTTRASLMRLGGDYLGSNSIYYSLMAQIDSLPESLDYSEEVYAGLMSNYESLNQTDSVLKYALKRIEYQKELLKKNIKFQTLLFELDENKRTLVSLQEKALIKEKKSLSWIILFLTLVIVLIPIVFYFGYKRYHTERLNTALQESNDLINLKNQELNELNEDKKQIIRLLSHDLRTPLVNTRGILEVYNSGLFSEQELKEQTHIALNNLTELQGNVDNLIRWASGQMDGVTIDLTKLNIYTLINELLSYVKDQAEKKGVAIDLSNLATDTQVLADKEQLSLIIRNLLSNAIKFSHEGGKVIVKTEVTSPGQLSLIIKDYGIGMQHDQLQSILAKGAKSTVGTAGEQGHGIGLRLVNHFAKKNNIGLDIESVPNQGTTCKLTLATV